MSLVHVTTLFLKATKEALFTRALDLASGFGLDVTSWRAGDPTMVELQFLSEQFETRDVIASDFAKSAFLSTAEDDWLKVHADEVYGIEADEATYSTPSVTLHNTGGGLYDLKVGQLTVKSSITGVTFQNTDYPGALTAGTTRTYQLVASVPGAAGTVAVNDIDELVTRVLGVTITGSTASVGAEAQSPEAIRTECTATLGALSASGPKDAYESVCLDSEKTGTLEITRARTYDAIVVDGGACTVFVASAAGTVSGPGVTAAQNACVAWAEPIGFQVTVESATALPIDIVIEVEG